MLTAARLVVMILIVWVTASFSLQNDVVIDREEARLAFELLNDIRLHAPLYREDLSLPRNLPVKKTALNWNPILAKVAETKAADMARRNYFGHTDPGGYGMNYYINKAGYALNPSWLRRKSDNHFESIMADAVEGEDAIYALIIDDGVPSFGHRNHLLGVGTWNASLTDIGIGFVRRDSGSTYTTYISVVIARHGG
jgi:hypothetical protein